MIVFMPCGKAEVAKAATPLPLTATVPSTVRPFMKVTEPALTFTEADDGACTVTVAVNVTACPAADELLMEDDFSATAVLAALTCRA